MGVACRLLRRVVWCLLITAVVLPVAADELESQAPSAQDVLDRMAKTYAGCRSYHDSGVVKTVFVGANGSRTVEQPFTTAFVRPDRFRFEFKETRGGGEAIRYIVWRKGMEVYKWWDFWSVVEKRETLDLALAGASGVSGGSAHTVPALLLPKEIGGRRLTDMTEVKRLEDAGLDKVDCFRIEGKLADSPRTLWIDKKTFLLRRIDTQAEFRDFRTVRTTTYDPVIDEGFPEEMLEFGAWKQ
jgi:outer membrane lipoprotein-sorting protein